MPAKSANRYLAAYADFMKFREQKKIDSFSENVVLVYFSELSERYKSSTLWSIFSMLRSTLNIHQSIDINSYTKLLAFLKRQSDGYCAKKSKVFTTENVKKFISFFFQNFVFYVLFSFTVVICLVCILSVTVWKNAFLFIIRRAVIGTFRPV